MTISLILRNTLFNHWPVEWRNILLKVNVSIYNERSVIPDIIMLIELVSYKTTNTERTKQGYILFVYLR